jgi:hypothetical protein
MISLEDHPRVLQEALDQPHDDVLILLYQLVGLELIQYGHQIIPHFFKAFAVV